ncbi:Protein ENHANCED DISEASE RESISTANCE 2-like [Hondaea fermentalgiana]|uniref:Protein ENHANCED DISEASE RESISTANCE 2-like n=1 Tax=Hondaea fermentalgiana TaxID=2315210 RepID=A0A2R5GJQ0_9STRA|nr:Protein ENHANCED DISEASE RESISTANCE 2-like [Hondaea fermentalgiana]|eukprot:GBG31110.1 Protein ENHANCED DISEASE RESISTANCE 2-like [Hondaea fermentalgiana]
MPKVSEHNDKVHAMKSVSSSSSLSSVASTSSNGTAPSKFRSRGRKKSKDAVTAGASAAASAAAVTASALEIDTGMSAMQLSRAPPRKSSSAPNEKKDDVPSRSVSAAPGAQAKFEDVRRFRRKSLVEKSSKAYSQSVNEQDQTGLPSKEGYLRKENRHGRWQKRFFVINNSHLNYYKHKTTHVLLGESATPSASIDLRLATHICVLARNGVPGSKFAIQTKSAIALEEECYFLRAHSHQEAAAWVEALNARRSHYAASEAPSQSPAAQRIVEETAEQIRQDSGISAITDTDGPDGAQYFDPYSISPPVRSSPHETNGGTFDTGPSDEYWLEGEDTDDDGFVSADEGVPGDGSSVEGDDESLDGDDARDGTTPSPTSSSRKSCVVSETLASRIAQNPPSTLETKYWHVPEIRKLQVRSESYLTTSKKQLADPALFQLVAVDNFLTEDRQDNIINHPDNRIAQAMRRGDSFPFMFVVHIQVPGPPFYSFVLYFAATEKLQHCLYDDCSELSASSAAKLPKGFPNLARKFFLEDTNEFRDQRFKLIPRINEGPFIVRKAVGSKPALVGKKLTQRYFRAKNVLELDLDIGSSSIAHRIVQLSIGYAKLLTVDMAFVIEGQDAEELPEQVIGLIRAVHVDFSKAVPLRKVPSSSSSSSP